ncbi:PaaI family thioesterase [Halapricum hydrolyticum]|uniref:PaaI family thioesterase n=1 Tax=Halapricum hydrolyticum TaxID=2979991 RepID=A0AAE3LF07_9EURY|nr:PaaI family thioesterase [Halapricum hydrolyticum]MCU4717887.1 PaaI family thioesterase [Halapricum hydrolyticum]MCU4727052.1 PaaI family thioesterase [Halapricum hydrolyticum]
MAEFTDDVKDLIQYHIEEEHGYLSWLGVSVEEFTEETITMTVPYDEKLTNTTSPPTMHGGVAATLADTAGGIALRPSLADPVNGGVATINLNVNYLQRASGDLTARAEVVRAGNSVGVSEIYVESETPDGAVEPVAVVTGAYRLFQD